MPITSTSKKFLQSIFDTEARNATVEWWKFDLNNKAVGLKSARAVDAAPAADDAVYWSVGLMKPGTTRSNANIDRVFALVADDVGTKIDEGLVQTFMPAPTAIVDTSHGNCQYVWAIASGMTVAEHGALWAGMERLLGQKSMDGSAPSHLFRLPEGVNGKPGKAGYHVSLRDGRWAKAYNYSALFDLMPARAGAPGLQGSVQGAGGSSPQPAPSREALEKLLDALPNDEDDYDYWINTGIATWGASAGADWGFQAWDKWSAKSPAYGLVHSTVDKWETFAGTVSAGWGALEILLKERVGVGALAGTAFDDDAPPPPGGVAKPLDAEQRRIAAHIVRTMGHEMRWNVSQKKWMMFSGDVWAAVDYDAGFWAAAQWAAGTPAKSAQTAGFAEGVSKHLRNTPSMIVTDGHFNTGAWLAGVPGGTLNLTNGTLRPAKASDMISKQLACVPDVGVGCPLWLRFLVEATSGDKGMQDFLQRWAGYCLTGDVRQHKFVYLWGPGGNGKSLFVETIKRLMGSYGVQAASDLFVKKAQKGHPDALARLAGARLVVVPEISGGEKWDVDLLKEVTGNAEMVARYMYGANFSFPVTFKIMSTGNHQPAFPGGINPAIERRFIYGKFEHRPRTIDDRLADKFEPEMPGILAWALEGLTRGYAAHKLDVPRSMAEAAQEYFDESDPVLRWKAECVVAETGAKMTVEEAFQSWQSWALTNNVRDWSSPGMFGKMVRNKGLFKVTVIRGKPTVSGWKIKQISPF